MFGIDLKLSLATVAVAAGLLAAAGPASAQQPGVIGYNGHAGLGASVYQHNQTDLEFLAAGVTDGTSNTIAFGERAAQRVLMADMGGQFAAAEPAGIVSDNKDPDGGYA